MTTGKTVVHINIGERQIEDIQGIDVIVTTKDNTKILYDKWYMTEQEDSKTGHWINIINKDLHDYRTGNKLCFECSECRSQDTYKFNYCPNCGARMFEPQKSVDKENNNE